MSSWDTDTGGFFEEGEVLITKARFGYDADYQDGELLVFVLEGDSDEAEEGTVRSLYSIGNGWETEDASGKTVVGNEKFRDSTNYALFFKAALKTDAADIIKERGYPDDATIWEGLRFHMKRQVVTRKIGEDEVESRVVLPTKFLGEGEADSGSKKKSPRKKASGGSTNNKAEKVLTAKLKALAKKHDDHDDFLVAALEQYEDELGEFGDLMESVMDEAGIWADAQS